MRSENRDTEPVSIAINSFKNKVQSIREKSSSKSNGFREIVEDNIKIPGDSKKTKKFLDILSKACVHLLVFLFPLYFLPTTGSPIELNKLSLLVFLVGIAAIAWMGKMVSDNKIQVKRSFLSIPIFVFTIVYVLSSIFSVYRENSIWGYTGGESMSLVALLFFVLLFYLVSNIFSTKKSAYALIANLLISASVVFLISFLQLIGINVFKFLGVEGRALNTIGTVYALASYAGAVLVFSLAILIGKVKGAGLKPIAIVASVLSLAVITLVNFKLVWLVLVLAMALLMIVGIIRNSREKSGLFLLPTIIFTFCFFGLFLKKPIVPIPGLPSEILPSVSATSQIAWSGLKEKFIFGAGPGNFSYLFAKYKQPMGDYSQINFSQGTSFVATLFATGGILTILSYLFLVVVMGRYVCVNVYSASFGKKSYQEAGKDDGERMIIPASILWFFVTLLLFLTVPSLTLLFGWWVAFALLDALSDKGEIVKVEGGRSKVSVLAEKMGMQGQTRRDNPKVSLVISLMFVAIITGFIGVIYVMSQKYIASFRYQKALTQAAKAQVGTGTVGGQTNISEDALQGIGNDLSQAIYYNQNRDVYYLALSDVYLFLAQKRISEKGKDLNDEDRAFVWNAVSQGIQAANSAIVVNKSNYNNYLKLASIYQGIIGLVEGIDQPALENYEKAKDLSPNDSFIYNQIARIYLARYDMEIIKAAQANKGNLDEVPKEAKDNLKKAEENLNKSTEISPDNQTAHLMLATIFELRGDLKKAIAIAEKALNLRSSDLNLGLVLSLLYYKDKDYDKAIALLKAMLGQRNDFVDARYVLGLCFAQKKDLASAKEQFTKINEAIPNKEDITQILKDLDAGNTNFLTDTGNTAKVDEVQQSAEEAQKQKDQGEKTILNGDVTQGQNQPATQTVP